MRKLAYAIATLLLLSFDTDIVSRLSPLVNRFVKKVTTAPSHRHAAKFFSIQPLKIPEICDSPVILWYNCYR